MTLDEAIKHAKDKAQEQRKDNDTCVVKEGYGCKDCAYYYSKPCIECAEEHEQLAEWLEELKEYEDLEEQGLLLKLPCKIGDTVYSITRDFISEYKICSIEKYLEGFFFNWGCEKGIYKNIRGFTHFEIGKTVFLTKEEAEQELKRMECAE
jgi:hypothetical protein